MRTKHLLLGALLLLGLIACRKPEPQAMEPTEALRPIYIPLNEVRLVGSEASRDIENAGKIFYKGQFIFVSERGKGVHIVNNSDPSNPVNVAFINIPGNNDLAVKGNTLYADNGPDLVSFDISDPVNATLSSRRENVFPAIMYPEERNVRFECVDPAQGVVVGWELVVSDQANCSR